jgi:hypothetical protein
MGWRTPDTDYLLVTAELMLGASPGTGSPARRVAPKQARTAGDGSSARGRRALTGSQREDREPVLSGAVSGYRPGDGSPLG